jgi:hypothetical protein
LAIEVTPRSQMNAVNATSEPKTTRKTQARTASAETCVGLKRPSSPVSTATTTQRVPPAIISMLVAMNGDFGSPADFEMTEPQAQDAAATISTTAPSRSTVSPPP